MNVSDTAADNAAATDHKNFYYPPGGILMWIVIFLELLTFGIAIVVFMYTAREERAAFAASASRLDVTIGSINTVVLLTSGYYMARCVEFFRRGLKLYKVQLALALLAGTTFLALKSVEYAHKLSEGLTLGSGTFFDFYWMLTGFHVVHVVVGMVILLWWVVTEPKKPKDLALPQLETGAAFWHLCDLIWLLLFPVLYLIF